MDVSAPIRKTRFHESQDAHFGIAILRIEILFRWKLDLTCTNAAVLLRPQSRVTGLVSDRT